MSDDVQDPPRELTERERRFVQEYLIDFNGAKAAQRAGWPKTGAAVQASRELRKVHVSDAIEAGQEKQGRRKGIKAEKVINELVRIAFSDLRRVASWNGEGIVYTDSDDLDDDTSAAIQAIEDKTTTRREQGTNDEIEKREIKIKLYDKVRALELLSKYLGLLKEDQKVSDPVGDAIKAHQEALQHLIDDQAMQADGETPKVEPL